MDYMLTNKAKEELVSLKVCQISSLLGDLYKECGNTDTVYRCRLINLMRNKIGFLVESLKENDEVFVSLNREELLQFRPMLIELTQEVMDKLS